MKKIVGIFKTEQNAVNAIENLKTQGYQEDEISVLVSDQTRYTSITEKTGLDLGEKNEEGSGALAGAAVGGTIGGVGGLLLGLGALAIPGLGPIVAAGPIAATLMGLLAGGAVGGLAGALVDYGIPEEQARDYEDRIKQGDIMVLVDDDDDEERRKSVYDNFTTNDSYNKNTYTYADTLVGRPDHKTGLDSPEFDINRDVRNEKGQTGNTNHIRDSYQKENDPPSNHPQYSDSRNVYGENDENEANPFKGISLDPHEDEK